MILRLELICALLVVIIGALSYFSHYPSFAISNVSVVGLDGDQKQGIETFVNTELQGGYLHLFSKHNFLLYPKGVLERGIFDQFKKVESVKLTVQGKHDLIVSVVQRGPYALWCNADKVQQLEGSTSTGVNLDHCYDTDKGGLAFQSHDASLTALPILFKTFDKENVVGENILDQEKFTNLRELIVSLDSLAIKTSSIIFKDNGDFEIHSDKNEKYIFGAGDDLKTDVGNLKLLLDSADFKNQTATSSKKIDYIDLRFGQKLYFKLL